MNDLKIISFKKLYSFYLMSMCCLMTTHHESLQIRVISQHLNRMLSSLKIMSSMNEDSHYSKHFLIWCVIISLSIIELEESKDYRVSLNLSLTVLSELR